MGFSLFKAKVMDSSGMGDGLDYVGAGDVKKVVTTEKHLSSFTPAHFGSDYNHNNWWQRWDYENKGPS